MRAAIAIAMFAAALRPASASAQTLQPAATVAGAPAIDVFAGGNVKDVLGGPEGSSAVSGTMGLRYRGHVFVVTSLINIAGTTDTLREGFGGSLLQPAIGKALNAGLLEIRAPRLPTRVLGYCGPRVDDIKCHFGARAYLSASSSMWQVRDSSGAPVGGEVVPSWGSGVDLSYTFVNGLMGDSAKAVAMILDAGWATRHIRGDVTTEPLMLHQFLGSNGHNFGGIEVGLTVQFDMITAGMTYYRFGGSIPGFSHGQLVAGASIQANISSGTYTHH